MTGRELQEAEDRLAQRTEVQQTRSSVVLRQPRFVQLADQDGKIVRVPCEAVWSDNDVHIGLVLAPGYQFEQSVEGEQP